MSEQSGTFYPPSQPDPFAGPPTGAGNAPGVVPADRPVYTPDPGGLRPEPGFDLASGDPGRHADTGPSDGGDASAKERAGEAAQAGRQAAGDVAQTAADKAKDVVGEAKSQAGNMVSGAQDQLREQAAAQHRRVVSNLHSLADELNAMAQGNEQSGPATQLVSEAGSRAKTAASWMDERDPEQLLDEVRSFARRRPGAFIVGALVAGVAAGRLTRGVVDVHRDDAGGSATSGGSTDSPLGDGA